jgi:hypothetical protein
MRLGATSGPDAGEIICVLKPADELKYHFYIIQALISA